MADPGALRIVLFRVGTSLWAMPAAAVREVIGAVAPTRIPGAGQTVAGLVNLRGSLLTVVDVRRAVGLADPAAAPESILVVERGERVYGLLVDEVLDLLEVASGDMVQATRPAGIEPGLIRATGSHRGRSFAVLDAEAVLAPVSG
jgi:purine-binding chemotaxis protein CheW